MKFKEPAIGINWGSSNLRAYLFDENGDVQDVYVSSDGVTKLDRAGMEATFKLIAEKWPEPKNIYLCGMVGSPVGLQEAPYHNCPARVDSLVRDFSVFTIDGTRGNIIPGMKCKTSWGEPDVMRGEEVELFGLLETRKDLLIGERFIVLPGTHSKWVKVVDGEIIEFFTSMSSEIFDHLSSKGLLSSIMKTPASLGEAFTCGVERGSRCGTGLSRMLFGVRAQVMVGESTMENAASYARGLLVGAEMQDAIDVYGLNSKEHNIALLGNGALCELYVDALKYFGYTGEIVDADNMVCEGFRVIHSTAMNIK